MEVSGAIKIFQCSESLHGLQYTKFLGDDDSKAYKTVNEIQVMKNWNVLATCRETDFDSTTSFKTKNERNNTDNVNSMKRAIWATYFHKASTDAYLQHGLCPTNEDSWREYNRAITTGEVYKHKNTLLSEVLDCIKDVYMELSTPNLLA
ncbi:putative kolobok-17 hm [Trichonephila clavipes]|nr:putative kolobok-17 hm [Trichonephila clavipes]